MFEESRNNEPARPGATLAGTPASALPMVVWLRGDEPYCEEFTLSADEVMEQLHIKRSRLTQISGQELRVGRMRQGRYIRPVYRQTDVDEYKTWVRPTASHVKSKQVVEEAQQKLESALEDVAATLEQVAPRLEAPLSQTEIRLSSQMAAMRKELLEAVALRATQTERSQLVRLEEMSALWAESQQASMGAVGELLKSHHHQMLDALGSSREGLQSLAMTVAHLEQRCARLAAELNATRDDLEERAAAWEQREAERAAAIRIAKRPQRRRHPRSGTVQTAPEPAATRFKPPRRPLKRR